MKGWSVIAVCILLASILFCSSSIHARELVEKTPQKPVVIGPPTVLPGDPPPYTSCTPFRQRPCLPPPKAKCDDPYKRNCHTYPPGN